jgi:preprotein translocase subunit YajC
MDWIMLAQTEAPAPPPQSQPPSGLGGLGWGFVVPVLFMLGVFYFLLIRPQKKQEKVRRQMLKELQKNDKVVTIGGIRGVVANVRPDDKVVTLKIDESSNVRIRVSRSAISRVLSKDEDEKEAD